MYKRKQTKLLAVQTELFSVKLTFTIKKTNQQLSMFWSPVQIQVSNIKCVSTAFFTRIIECTIILTTLQSQAIDLKLQATARKHLLV